MKTFETKYYPLVDCDTDGTEKVPMFVSTSGTIIDSVHSMYLAEIVPNFYRLYCNDKTVRGSGTQVIHCPLCGSVMQNIAEASDEKKLGLYTCNKCQYK